MIALVFRFTLCALTVSGCVAAPAVRTPAAVPATVKPASKPASALTERTPDTCRLASLGTLVGQPSGNLRTVRLAGASRIIPPGGIVDQMDYVPQRINAYIDDQGIIIRLECG